MSEWDRRQLCPDGACVGVIGPDGTCKVCGRAAPGYDGAYRSGPTEVVEEKDPDETVEKLVEKAETAIHDVEWSERKLCPDGACTGVIGDDGKCKVCGRSAA